MKAVPGHQQHARVELAGAKHARVAVELWIECVGLGIAGGQGAFRFEASAIELVEKAAVVKLEKSIERDPAQQTRVRTMFRLAARLPDALIRFPPVVADIFAKIAEQL